MATAKLSYRRDEANRSDQCEDESRRFSVVEEGCRKEVAGCGDDEFRGCFRTGEDFGQRGSCERQNVKSEKPKSRGFRKQSHDLDENRGLDLATLCSTKGYVDLKGIGKRG